MNESPCSEPDVRQDPRYPHVVLVATPLLLLLVLAALKFSEIVREHLESSGVVGDYWVLMDAPLHGAIALLVVLPIVYAGAHQRLRLIGITALAAMLLDIDHFIAAQSISVHDAIHLSSRPASHSFLFAIGVGAAVFAVTRWGVYAWIVTIGLCSHILRDVMTGAVPLFWPVRIGEVDVLVAYLGHAVLCLATILFAAGIVARGLNDIRLFRSLAFLQPDKDEQPMGRRFD